ncbi:AAA family ATPase [Thiomicrospira sp. ALE5]|uniref:AAA family ATPase n=1 Tax=Thiomicrospira sp. ALE5 TaxID=748650 RepID=UPI0008E84F35|nr:AAA family ATPase [Thiomicrospira sp. ALE5]SFR52934.1 Predicted ATP-binding protein involved in virulence [Thiomicrospira sp. ALE5]
MTFSLNKLNIEGLKGVGRVAADFEHAQRAYVVIGENGVGKTKLLEAMFQYALYHHSAIFSELGLSLKAELLVFSSCNKWRLSDDLISFSSLQRQYEKEGVKLFAEPLVYLGSQSRGFIDPSRNAKPITGTFEQRHHAYIKSLFDGMSQNFSNLNMNANIEQWFVTLAQSSNPYQSREDNREVEIKTVLQLLNQLDERIDPQFMEISGDEKVSLKIDGQVRKLSQLSSGFMSILKIIQSIVSGFSYFTNERQLQHVPGLVFIDEIESHLHLSWQARIIPTLKTLFPNATFYITTHSSVILSQLKEGEAYRLQRDKEGIVKTHRICSPANASMVDILKDVFGIDMNAQKLNLVEPSDQAKAKKQLLELMAGGQA